MDSPILNSKPESGALEGIKGRELVVNWSQSATNPRPVKTPKGTVKVESSRDRLRLRWSYQGQRFTLYLELPDTATNRKIAEAKARIIERDMATEHFDKTLERYRSERGDKTQSIAVVGLFKAFIEFKSKTVLPQSLIKYEALLGHLEIFFKAKPAEQVGEIEAQQFREWLSKRLEPITVRERLALVNACWNWAVKKKMLKENPWSEQKVRVPRKQRPKPFTESEIKRIVEGFRADRHYRYYADYVEFLLGTGCRLEEGIALRWRHLNEDCSIVHFIEACYRGQFKGLKTEDERFVSLTAHLQTMLLNRRPERYSLNDLVFPAFKGGVLDDHNFRRVWKIMLDAVKVPYRAPRNTRHTLVSHALDRGMSPAEVSELTGHSIETMLRSYAGNVKNRPKLPDLLGD